MKNRKSRAVLAASALFAGLLAFASPNLASAEKPVETTVAVSSRQSGPVWENGRLRYWDGASGAYLRNRWRTIDGKSYYFGNGGFALTGRAMIGKATYRFDFKTCEQYKDRWFTVGSNTYYYNRYGVEVRGMQRINGSLFGFYANGAQVKDGWLSVGENTYYFNRYGAPLKGVRKIEGVIYGFYDNGVQVKGRWFTRGGKTYYFNKYGVALRGARRIGGVVYGFRDDGAQVKNGWLSAGGRTYFFNAYGAPIKGLKAIGGVLYAFDSDGVQYKNAKKTFEGKTYAFNAYGVGKGEYSLPADAYAAQRLGTNPVYYYKHPTLPLALDFRKSPDLARDKYVVPYDKGFYVYLRRPYLVLSRVSGLTDQRLGQWDGPVGVGKVVFGDYRDVEYILHPGYHDGPDPEARKLPSGKWIGLYPGFSSGYDDMLYADANVSRPDHGPDRDLFDCIVSTNAAESPYVGRSRASIDASFIREHIEEDPGMIEWDYGLPLYSKAHQYYEYMRDREKYYPPASDTRYRIYDRDVLGDSAKELIIDCSSSSDAAPGYTAVFMFTPQGLLLADLTEKSYPGQSFYGLR